MVCFPSPPVSKMEESLYSLDIHGALPFSISKLSDAVQYHSSLWLTPSPTEVFLIWVFRAKVTSVNDCLRMISGLSPSSKSIGWPPKASLLNHDRLWSATQLLDHLEMVQVVAAVLRSLFAWSTFIVSDSAWSHVTWKMACSTSEGKKRGCLATAYVSWEL